MNNLGTVDKKQVQIKEVLKEGYIPFLGGRPERSTVISRDNILDLTIMLNITHSVEDFIKQL